MEYVEVRLTIDPLEPAREIATAYLAEGGYDMFEEEKNGLKAYISSELWDEAFLRETIDSLAFAQVSFEYKVIEDQNWNAQWESQFQAIDVDGRCYIKAPFHDASPEGALEILIEPQMSFGTGHHATTYQMVKAMLDMEWQDKVVLDMGAGTAILAILAEKKGARKVLAIDIEEWAFRNAGENTRLNACERIEVMLGDVALLPKEETFDVILANINRNILIQDMEAYLNCLISGGHILFSGFFPSDNDLITNCATSLGLVLSRVQEKDGWSQLTFVKKA